MAEDIEVAVIGGGPAGLMAAEMLGGEGLAVAVFDRMPTVGRKLLMAGRGGLNLTHSEPLARMLDRYGPAAATLRPMLEAFDNEAVRAWAEGLGQPVFTGSSGRVFPKALKASPLLRAWLARLAGQGVEIHTRHDWQGFGADGALRFRLADGGERQVRPKATVLAMGGASWPRLGADGGWVAPLRAAGIEVRDLAPANAGIDTGWSPAFAERFAGKPLKTVEIGFGDNRQRGDLVITAYGLEGGAIYTLGPAIREVLAQDGKAALRLDLRPDGDARSIAARLAKAFGKGRSRANALRALGLAPQAVAILREVPGGLPAEPLALAALLKAVPLEVSAQQPLARAISTAGGVAFEGLDERLMLKGRPGVFVAGEMLDWEAPTGGYLLQACLATGHRAAQGVSAFLAARHGA